MSGQGGVRPSATPGLHRQGTSLWDRIWRPFWALPAAIIAASGLLGLILPSLDPGDLPLVFGGGPDSARTVLSSIVGGMISLTGLVFSITIVVLQLASSQFTPRILRQFLAARVVQASLGVFTGTFVYGLVVLRTVQSATGDGPDARDAFVPQVSVSVAMVFVLASVGLFIAFIAHITRQVQVSEIISDLTRRTRQIVLEFRDAADGPPRASWEPGPQMASRRLVNDERQGYVVAIHADDLVSAARELDVVVELDLAIGQYVAPGAPLGRVWGELDEQGAARLGEVRDHVFLEDDRLIENDPMFGMRQLVDIAERALSPGINDPTTAVQIIDAAQAVLRAAGGQSDPSAVLIDADGAPRAIYRPWTFERMLTLAVEEVARYGDSSPRVQRGLHELLTALETDVRVEHVAAVRGWREQLEEHNEPDAVDEDKDADA